MLKMKHNREKIRWVFQRMTGLQLLICFGIHIWVFFFKLDQPIGFHALHELFSHPVWVIFYSLFIMLAIYHGFLGIWTILTDKNPSISYKKTWKIILIIFGSILSLISISNFILLGQV